MSFVFHPPLPPHWRDFPQKGTPEYEKDREIIKNIPKGLIYTKRERSDVAYKKQHYGLPLDPISKKIIDDDIEASRQRQLKNYEAEQHTMRVMEEAKENVKRHNEEWKVMQLQMSRPKPPTQVEIQYEKTKQNKIQAQKNIEENRARGKKMQEEAKAKRDKAREILLAEHALIKERKEAARKKHEEEQAVFKIKKEANLKKSEMEKAAHAAKQQKEGGRVSRLPSRGGEPVRRTRKK